MEPSEIQNIFVKLGQRIRMYRRLQGYQQKEFATKCGIEPSNLSRIEKGHTNPTLRTLCLVAEELGMSVDMLLKDL